VRDHATEKPVSTHVSEAFRCLYAYGRTPLDPKTDSADESGEFFRSERVSYSAAYTGERIPAILLLCRECLRWRPLSFRTGN